MAVDSFFNDQVSTKECAVKIELGAACMRSGHAFDRTTAPGYVYFYNNLQVSNVCYSKSYFSGDFK